MKPSASARPPILLIEDTISLQMVYRSILTAAGYRVVETDPVGMCCGAAGMYTVHHPEASTLLGNQKADQVRATGVTKVASANPGCEMQLRSHLDDQHDIRHPIEWYAAALSAEGLL
jgi:Fe-S oxidoreductase